MDFNILGTDHHPTNPVDWWDNSVEATKANWTFAVDHQDSATCDGDDDYTTYGPLSWGLTAADGITGYHAYGALPVAPGTNPVHDGTIAPYGAGSTINFVPVTSTLSLKHYFTATDLWRYRVGFGDGYNLDPNDCGGRWYNHATFGIDQGPMLLALENHRSSFVWQTFMKNPQVAQALCLLWCQTDIAGVTSGVAGNVIYVYRHCQSISDDHITQHLCLASLESDHSNNTNGWVE